MYFIQERLFFEIAFLILTEHFKTTYYHNLKYFTMMKPGSFIHYTLRGVCLCVCGGGGGGGIVNMDQPRHIGHSDFVYRNSWISNVDLEIY